MRDDRGKAVPAHHIREPREIAADIKSAVQHEADMRFGEEPAWKKVVRLAIGLPVLYTVLIGSSYQFFGQSPQHLPWYWILVWAFAGFVLCWVLGIPRKGALNEETWFTPWWYSTRLKRKGMKLWGFCPACGYDLSEQVVTEDECVVCPECGGAWRWTRRIQARVAARSPRG